MPSNTVEYLQTRLKERETRIMECDGKHLRFLLSKVLHFLQSDGAIGSILASLAKDHTIQMSIPFPTNTAELESILSSDVKDEKQYAAWALNVWRFLQASNYKDILLLDQLFGTVFYSTTAKDQSTHDRVKKNIILPVLDYLREQLDAGQLLFHQLLRYKARCEVFDYRRLVDEINNYLAKTTGRKRLEKLLQADLYRYLHDEGIDFAIEPKYVDDMIDIIASFEKDPEKKLVETKVIKKPEKTGIQNGYNQIVTYCQRYSTDTGYLAIYNLTQDHIAFELETFQALPYLQYGGETIYFLVIKVPLKPVSASDGGRLKSLSITRDDLIAAMGQPESPEED